MEIYDYVMNDVFDDDKFQQLQAYDLIEHSRSLCNSFENLLSVENISSLNIDTVCEFLKGKIIAFNGDNSWTVTLDGEMPPEEYEGYENLYTKFIFYFNNETCALNLNRDEAIQFLTKSFFKEFVIPSDVGLELDPEDDKKYKLKYEIHHGYKSIYSEEVGYRRNIYQVIEFIRGLHLSACFNQKSIADGKVLIYNLPYSYPFPTIFSYLSHFNISKDGSYRYDFIRASQYISGRICYYYLHNKVEKKTIVLSHNMDRIFQSFDESKQIKVSKIMKANFLNITIPPEIMIQNGEELRKIRQYIYAIWELANFEGPRSVVMEKAGPVLKLLIEFYNEKKLSPLVLQKIGFVQEYERIFEETFGAERVREVEELYENSRPILEFFDKSLLEAIRSYCAPINVPEETRERNIATFYLKLYDPQMSYGEYLESFSPKLPEEMVVVRFYKYIEHLISFCQKADFSRCRDMTKEGRMVIDIINIGFKDLYQQCPECYEDMYERFKFSYSRINGHPSVSIIYLKPMAQEDSGEEYFIRDKKRKEFRVCYSHKIFDYFIVIPDGALNTDEGTVEELKTFKSNLRIYPERFLIQNLESLECGSEIFAINSKRRSSSNVSAGRMKIQRTI